VILDDLDTAILPLVEALAPLNGSISSLSVWEAKPSYSIGSEALEVLGRSMGQSLNSLIVSGSQLDSSFWSALLPNLPVLDDLLIRPSQPLPPWVGKGRAMSGAVAVEDVQVLVDQCWSYSRRLRLILGEKMFGEADRRRILQHVQKGNSTASAKVGVGFRDY
jgi:hypothetical protein